MKFLKNMPKVKLQKILLVIIMTLIVTGAMGNFWVAKKWSEWSSHAGEIAKLQTEIDQTQASAKQEASNTELRDQIRVFVETQQQRMVSGDPFSWVVREISLLAEKHPIRVMGMRPGEKAPNALKSRYEMFSAQFEIEGTYDQVGVFLRDFENHFTTSQIRSLEMYAPDPTRPICRVALQCALLVLPQDAAKSPAKSVEEKKT